METATVWSVIGSAIALLSAWLTWRRQKAQSYEIDQADLLRKADERVEKARVGLEEAIELGDTDGITEWADELQDARDNAARLHAKADRAR